MTTPTPHLQQLARETAEATAEVFVYGDPAQVRCWEARKLKAAHRILSALEQVSREERKEAQAEERAHGRTIDARDNAEEWADRLAEATGEVGEHSNMNNPWERGLENIDQLRKEAQALAAAANNAIDAYCNNGTTEWGKTLNELRAALAAWKEKQP